jgi:hypothetical protein
MLETALNTQKEIPAAKHSASEIKLIMANAIQLLRKHK